MQHGDMHNVVYRRTLSSAKEDMGGVSANLFLTHESNGYAIFFQEGASWFLLCYFPEHEANRAVEVAVSFGQRNAEDLRPLAKLHVYPNSTC